jgi:ATP-dependent Lon protease
MITRNKRKFGNNMNTILPNDPESSDSENITTPKKNKKNDKNTSEETVLKPRKITFTVVKEEPKEFSLDSESLSDEESFYEDIEYFEENLDDNDLETLRLYKKTDPFLYEKFKKAKDLIKSREISLKDILSAKISDDKRATLIELYECFRQMYPGTQEYIDCRNSIKTLFNRFIETSKEIEKNSNSLLEKEPFVSEADLFRKNIKELVCSSENRKVLEEKVNEFEDSGREDKLKIKTWLKTALALPFDKISYHSYDIKQKLKETFDYISKKLYGMQNVKERLMIFLNKKLHQKEIKGCNIALLGGVGVGKCHGKNTPILMYDGTIKMVQDIKVGEKIMGDDSMPRNVLSLARGKEKMFKIRQISGCDYVVNKSHILSLKKPSINGNFEIVDIPLVNYLKLSESEKNILRGFKVGVNFFKQEVPYDPYIIGSWLGDTSNDNKTLMKVLRENNMTENRHIPSVYKLNDKETRLKVLAGIIDTNAYLHNNYYVIIENEKLLADDITFLCRSLGFNVNICERKKHSEIYFRLTISGSKLSEIPVFYKTKKVVSLTQIKDVLNTEIIVEHLDIDDFYGFEIDGNHRYLLGDFTVTHNTSVIKCISHVLNIPFAQINFGGVSNVDFILGHEYTFIGSKQGEISRCLTRMGSKNGIIYMDEFNRISDKKEIMSTLLHITDFTQNYEFRDNYHPELVQDLSKIWFVYSMNHLPEDKALADRLEVIDVDGYLPEERKHIAKEYVFKKILEELKINIDIQITDDAYTKIVTLTGEGRQGVRNLERYVNLIIEKVYFFLCNLEVNTYNYKWYKKMEESFNKNSKKLSINEDIVSEILKDCQKEEVFHNMYL